MQIKVRVRTNDVSEERKTNQLVHNGFTLYDNCSEVKFGEKQIVSLEEFRAITSQWRSIAEIRNSKIYNTHPETNDQIDNIIYMVRDIEATEQRLNESRQKTGIIVQNPYHYNVIEWIDRVTYKRYRLLFDTLIFLMDDKGNTLRKIEG